MFLHYPVGIFRKFMKGAADDTHFSPFGAMKISDMVAEAILASNEHLRSFLKKSIFPQKYEFELPLVSTPVFKKDTFNIISYGAVSSSNTLNTGAIQQAIDMAAKQGGGMVLVPSGFWLTGPIKLLSNVNLHISRGAILQFSNKPKDYPLIRTNWEGVDAIRAQSPISAKGQRNIAITGSGIIDGAGEAWRPVKKGKLTAGEWIS